MTIASPLSELLQRPSLTATALYRTSLSLSLIFLFFWGGKGEERRVKLSDFFLALFFLQAWRRIRTYIYIKYRDRGRSCTRRTNGGVGIVLSASFGKSMWTSGGGRGSDNHTHVSNTEGSRAEPAFLADDMMFVRQEFY